MYPASRNRRHREHLADLVTISRSHEQCEQVDILNRHMVLGLVFLRLEPFEKPNLPNNKNLKYLF